MSIVVLIDQRDGQAASAVSALAAHLNEYLGNALERPFERAVGDQVVGILDDPLAVSRLLVAVDDADGDWLTAVGFGELDELGDTARECSGPALRAAKRAAERARKAPNGVAVDGHSDFAADIDSAALLLGDILAGRSERQRAVIALRRAQMTGEQIAQRLDITRRAVHKHLSAGRFALEQEATKLIDRLALRAAR